MVQAKRDLSQKLDILSIAYDNADNLEKVKHIVEDKHMNWAHIWDDQNGSGLVKKFQVTSFPTYILVDPSGKIIYSAQSIYGLKDLLSRVK